MSNSIEIIKMVWPLLLIQLSLQVYALVDLIRKKKTNNLTPLVWGVLIVFGQLLGALVYILYGRSEEV